MVEKGRTLKRFSLSAFSPFAPYCLLMYVSFRYIIPLNISEKLVQPTGSNSEIEIMRSVVTEDDNNSNEIVIK